MARKPKLELVASNEPAPLAAPEGVPQQVEMPFAMVNGEPVTEMPKDLYIPPQALEVFLEAFEGPLDLLLYLIRRQNLDILDIPLAEITRQYMKYIDVMQDLQLELAGEYMVMAATLAEIKSRMLLPRPKVAADEEDPRAELVRRLQEYERFKRAAEDVDKLPRLERDHWIAGAELKDRKVVRLLPQVTLQEMLVAFKDVVIRSEMFSHHHVARERLSVRERMSNILTSLEQASFVEFVHLFRPEEGRMGVTVTFIAILELMREGLIEIVQAQPYAPIHLRSSSEKRTLRLVANNETPEQVAHAAALGETVLEEVVAERAEEEARSLADDVGFVDDDDVAEEEIEDFGLDDIKVPEVDLGKTDFPRRMTTDDGVDDAGIVDTDVADDEDKSPPDEGRS
jgi:segregation and condensation protein A